MGTTPDSIRVVGEGDMLALARVPRSTWQNWLRHGLLAHEPGRRFSERDVVELVVAGLLVGSIDLRRAVVAWPPARTDSLAQCLALPLDEEGTLDAVVDLHTWVLRLARNRDELYDAVRERTTFPRGRVVVPLAEVVRETRSAFWARAVPPSAMASDRGKKGDKAGGQRRSRKPKTQPSNSTI